jgi:hypothetical protein
MKLDCRWLVVPLAIGLQLAGCKHTPEDTEDVKPVKIEHLAGAEPARVTLIESAAKRLQIQTDTVREMEIDGTLRMVVPYAAILYDTQGATWVFTSSQPLTYVRHAITIDRIVGDLVVLSQGPPQGTAVVTVGAAELYGSEIEFEEE